MKKYYFKKGITIVAATALAMGMFWNLPITEQIKQVSAKTVLSDNRIRVDLNLDNGRKEAYSNVFENFLLTATSATSFKKTINGVTFTLSNGGTSSAKVKGVFTQKLIKSDDVSTPKLTMDGITTEDSTSGVIKLEIEGLSPGSHSLQTWHSFCGNVAQSKMKLSINGEVKVPEIASKKEVYKDSDAAITYSQFTVAEGEKVTVLITPTEKGNAILNAFALDCADPTKTISNPSPVENNKHFDQSKGLSWTAGSNAVSHDIYLGTDLLSVIHATESSPEFKGNQTATTFFLDGLDMDILDGDTYYWRVDEIASDGIKTKGDPLSFEIRRLAFPSAQGYGRFAKGGRGGRVVEVTNLNDSGEGSLRDAVENQKGARTIVFRVGGVIELKSRLEVPKDGGNVYIAGQTAPGEGITITKYAFGLDATSEVIMRHIRLRVGDENGVAMDGIGMANSDNSIVDHCSISWTTDEGTSTRGARNITFQYNIIAESLNASVHYDGNNRESTQRHSFAGSISGNIGSFYHNLLVNNTGRNWSLAGNFEQDRSIYAGYLDITNNVVYNWRDRTTDGGVRQVNFVNNYYKMGAVSRNMTIITVDGNELNPPDRQRAYVSGNKMVSADGKTTYLESSQDAWAVGKAKPNSKFTATLDEVRSFVPFFPSYVNEMTADEAYESVLANVGANVPRSDYLDVRYIRETREGSWTLKGSVDGLKGIIDSQTDAGGYPVLSGGTAPADTDHDGMPDDYETYYGLNPNDASDRNGFDLSEEKYTNLEMYLNELAGDDVIYKSENTPATPAPPTAMPTAGVPTGNCVQSPPPTPEITPTPITEPPTTPPPITEPPMTAPPTPTAEPTPTPSPSPGKILMGDMDDSDNVNLDDVQTILKMALTITPYDKNDELRADFTEDGDITLDDVQITLKIALTIDEPIYKEVTAQQIVLHTQKSIRSLLNLNSFRIGPMNRFK